MTLKGLDALYGLIDYLNVHGHVSSSAGLVFSAEVNQYVNESNRLHLKLISTLERAVAGLQYFGSVPEVRQELAGEFVGLVRDINKLNVTSNET